ncbi:DUF4129 domain-containing protein [Aquisphaera insulae]|uniref:DUF4129 domain-containing protein n=1 Tax=Aquisphaera insulae TaxID=2712864 RepID=UPI0013EBDC15|nr:DUF4129 domain-containing protein [Aquisphaera insulae]
MARGRLQGTLVDHLVNAIVPVLIMVMVGSLTFFMLDIWYDGPFLERLRWILFWFVFGIVLITRVGMQIGDVAKGYGLALGGAVALVATSLAGFQPFLLGVMALVWWATHHLTYDCTLMDENQDAGVGLMEESGLAREQVAAGPDGVDPDPHRMDASLLGPPRPWWKAWGGEGSSANSNRPHAPGVWLIYFALASLPVFGVGQWLVPAVEEERRAGLLVYAIAYIAAAMGLLLATSFLNLRRYLRKRKIPMPRAMTATWLTTGGFVIAGLTVLSAALLPAIGGVRSITGSAVSSSDRRASRWAVLKDGGVQGDGAESEGRAASKADEPQEPSGEEQGSGKTNDPNAAKQTAGKGRAGGKSQPGNAKSGAAKGKSASGKGNASGKQGKQAENAKDAGKPQGKADDSSRKDETPGGDQDSAKEKDSSETKGQEQGSNSASTPNPPSLSFQAPAWLRIPVLIVGGCFLLYGAFRYGPELLKGFLAFLSALFGGLWFGRPRDDRGREAVEEAARPAEPPRPFSSFANPFDVGMDRQFAPNDLFVYSFQALEAWAYEAGAGRLPHETPVEFARRLGAVRGDLSAEANRLAAGYVRIVYGSRVMKPEALEHLRVFWRALEAQGLVAAGR